MKKICAVIAVMMMLSSCSGKSEPTLNKTPLPNTSAAEAPQDGVEVIGIKNDSGEYDSMNKYSGCVYDINGDGAEEEILLLTSAKKDSDGEYVWDDSQSWALIVKTDDGVYPLFEEHAHGKLKLYVSERYDNNGDIRPIIRLEASSSSEFSIKEYSYNGEDFEKKVVYDAGVINELSTEEY